MFLEDIRNGFCAFGRWVFYIFLALFPFIVYRGQLFYGTTSRSVNLLIVIEVLTIIFGFVLFQSQQRLRILRSPITYALLSLLLISFCSALSGVSFSSSFWSKATRSAGLFYFLHLGFFYLYFLMFFHEKGTLRTFLKVFLISAGIASIGAFLYKDGIGLIFQSKPWTGFTFGNSTFAAMYVYVAFLLSIYYVSTTPSRPWWKYLIPLVFIINPYLISRDLWYGKLDLLHHPLSIVGEAQASSFTMLFSVLFLFYAWCISRLKNVRLRRGMLWGTTIVGIVMMTLAIHSFLSEGGYLRKAYLTQASSARPIVWSLSQKAIAARPVLGWGGDNFDRAFEAYYDNRLMEDKNGAEAWFDKAHNIFIDQGIESGYIGIAAYLMVYLVIIGCMLYVIRFSGEKDDRILAVILITYFIGHIMELQTAFDTTISYIPLILMAGIAALVFSRTRRLVKGNENEWVMSLAVQQVLGTGLILAAAVAFFWGTIPIVRAETANGMLRKIGSSEKRLPLYATLFHSPLDKASFLWRTSSDLQRGIAQKPDVINDPKSREGFKKEFDLFANEYKSYLAKYPLDYRSHLSLADVYIYERLFEVDHLEEAQTVLDQAIALSPQIPQAYWMKAVAYLYEQKFDLARTWAKKGYDLNPNIAQSKKIVEYIDRSIKTFPEIDLYSFWQI